MRAGPFIVPEAGLSTARAPHEPRPYQPADFFLPSPREAALRDVTRSHARTRHKLRLRRRCFKDPANNWTATFAASFLRSCRPIPPNLQCSNGHASRQTRRGLASSRHKHQL